MPFAALVVVLSLIFATFSLTRFLTEAADGLLGLAWIAQLVALKALIALEVLLPLALFLSLIVALGRLYSDSEMTALRASGVSITQLVWPALRLALLLAVAVGLFSWFIRPWAYARMDQLEAEAEATTELDRIRAGQFYVYAEQDRTVFIESVNNSKSKLGGVFVRTRSGGEEVPTNTSPLPIFPTDQPATTQVKVDPTIEVVTSTSGRLAPFVEPGQHALELNQASIYRRGSRGPALYGQFDKFTLRLEVPTVGQRSYRAKAAPSVSLLESAVNEERAELQWRAATAPITALLALLAIPLSSSAPRRGRYGKLMLAVAIYALYYNLTGIARGWVEQGTMHNLFWAVLLPLPIIAYLFFRETRLPN